MSKIERTPGESPGGQAQRASATPAVVERLGEAIRSAMGWLGSRRLTILSAGEAIRPVARRGYELLVPFGTDGAGVYTRKGRSYLVDTAHAAPRLFSKAIGIRLGNPSMRTSQKAVYRLGSHWAMGIYHGGWIGSRYVPAPPSVAAQQSDTLDRLRAIFDGYQKGFAERFIVPEYGPFALQDGSVAVVYPFCPALAKDGSVDPNDPSEQNAEHLLNQNTLDDLAAIRAVLTATRTHVADLQFLILADGHVMIADPLAAVGPMPAGSHLTMAGMDDLEALTRRTMAARTGPG